MKESFLLDLRCARRKSGLSQIDVGHLLSGSASKYSRIENGFRLPTHQEAIAMSLIFGRSFESLHALVMYETKEEVARQLSTLPDPKGSTLGRFNRQNTLSALAERLIAQPDLEHEG